MTTRMTISLLLLLTLLPGAALAAEADLFGKITLGARAVSDSGDSARAEEYGSLDNGAFIGAQIYLVKGAYHLEFEAVKAGRYELSGGHFDCFDYRLYSDEIEHKLSNDALTPYAGEGDEFLVNTGNPFGLWHEFDYSITQKKTGIETEISLKSPFFVEIGAANKTTEGVVPIGGAFPQVELPAPVDWQEKTAFIGGGYRSKTLVATLRGEVSEFDNDKERLTWDGGVTSQAPDNNYAKLSGQLVWRAPVLDSTLALRASHSNLESNLPLYIIAPGGINFEGDVSYTTFNASYDFTPIDGLDAKLYYKYIDRDNDAPQVTTLDGNTNVPFKYDRKTMGGNLSYALPVDTSIDLGYEWADTDRSGRSDSDGNEDDLAFVQLRNRSLDDVELRVKYEYLQRDGDPANLSSPVDRAYDVADQERQRVEFGATAYLTDNLDMGVEYAWSETDFDDTTYGLTDLDHQEVYLHAGYGMEESFRLSGYVGLEDDESRMDSSSGGGYGEKNESDTYAYGFLAEVPVTKAVMFSLGWDYSKTDGDVTFNRPTLLKISNDEDYTKKSLECSCSYQVNKALKLTLGYLYEKYLFSDDQWDGYTYLIPGGTLSGAYADQDYETNLGYLKATYQF